MAPSDRRQFIAVHNKMPTHPKVEGLSDKAFRLLVSLWCWCDEHRTDGFIRQSSWDGRSTAKARGELVEFGLAVKVRGGVQMHDYLEHQWSAEEIKERTETKSAAGKRGGGLGNHRKWHVQRGLFSPDCEYCVDVDSETPPDPESIGKRSAPADENDRQTIGKTSLPTPTPTSLPILTSVSSLGGSSVTRETQPPPSKFCPQHPEGTDGPCGKCADARKRRERYDDDQTHAKTTAATRRKAAINRCGLCDDNGMTETVPSVRCGHLREA